MVALQERFTAKAAEYAEMGKGVFSMQNAI